MGADFISAGLWKKTEDAIDFEAGKQATLALDREVMGDLAEQCGFDYTAIGPDEEAELREHAAALVETIKGHFAGASRELNSVQSPDLVWTYYYAGGMSWGDSPSGLFDAFNDLYSAPSVLKALGFWTP